MSIRNGIAYAGEPDRLIKVSDVRPMQDFKLWVRFSNGEAKIFDFLPLLSFPAYLPLKEEAVFRDVYIDCGVAVWQDGDIDIAPEYLYEHGVSIATGSLISQPRPPRN